MTDPNQEPTFSQTSPSPEPEAHHAHHAHHTPHHSDTDQSLFMGILAYIGVLIIIPYLVAKHNPFVKFHIKQGAVLVAIEIVLWVLIQTGMFYLIMPIISIIQLAVIILAIIGIVNVIQKKEKELPVVGSFAKHLKF